MLVCGFFVSALLCAFVVDAAPPPELVKRQAITTLTASQISAFNPFTFFASTAYCNPSNTLAWDCAICNANADFVPVESGGDRFDVQFWYVGFSPSQKTVIVAHQGTDATKCMLCVILGNRISLMSFFFSYSETDATDADVVLEPLDSTLFPGISSSIEVHSGFAFEQAKTATTILAAVRKAISAHRATKVTVVGHSLGAAIALLDSVYLPLHISGVTFRAVVHGMPRVGNQAFANYVDAHLSLTHINNKKDPVPIVPGRFLGYHHPSGEVHITESGSWVSCPGQDNPSTECIVGDVPNLLLANPSDHYGPYDGVIMGC
ncbi:uncharacterized protein LACBIDRAFT_301626 [Laccaria bicolor S238N-H82]|uniref:Predicted protein n=1 Tax=Laccaria bicolor (strain S238N-H82 / ATCC MYA-4686) TaxID=486041 RepID=B0CNY1_LACBS|nr:uncharacterized protein LACBIDRAFT_301626 [Laccaria bicolor S238N-H82]EDR15374.1 predicted protein [Laccaria bicolor S238N-H82]|eukprot:XP_001873582.1 predicted protein [Laccaria bicolor S238N-H82]